MKPRMVVTVTILLLALAGCSGGGATAPTYGHDFDSNRAKDIVDGKTTKAELLDWFGEPTSRSSSGAKETSWRWVYQDPERSVLKILDVSFKHPDYEIVSTHGYYER